MRGHRVPPSVRQSRRQKEAFVVDDVLVEATALLLDAPEDDPVLTKIGRNRHRTMVNLHKKACNSADRKTVLFFHLVEIFDISGRNRKAMLFRIPPRQVEKLSFTELFSRCGRRGNNLVSSGWIVRRLLASGKSQNSERRDEKSTHWIVLSIKQESCTYILT